MRHVIPVIVSIFVATITAAQAGLRDDLQAIVEEGALPVLAYAIVEDGEIVATEVLGAAPEHALFRAGSVSKIVTTLMILSLVADGILSLDMEIADILGHDAPRNRWRQSDPIRLIHLLEQTSGLPGTSYADYGNEDPAISPSVVVANRSLETRWPPGRFFSYANINHTVAAAVAERVTGQSFDDLVAARALSPMGMDRATFRFDMVDGLLPSFDETGKTAQPWHLAVRPSGALIADIASLANLTKMLATDGAGFPGFDPDLVRRMRSPATSLAAQSGYDLIYGAGVFQFLAAETLFLGHWGRIDGFQSTIGTHPETGDGFALIANGADRRSFHVARERLALHVTGGRIPAPLAQDTSVSYTKDHVGWWIPFTHDNPDRSWLMSLVGLVRLTQKDGTLVESQGLAPWLQTKLVPVSPNSAAAEGMPFASHVFSRDPDGDAFLLGAEQQSLERVSFVEALLRIGTVWALFPATILALAAGVFGLVGQFRRKNPALSWTCVSLGLGAAAFGALQVLHASWGLFGTLTRIQTLSEVNMSSLLLFALSLLWPTFILLSALILLGAQTRIGIRSRIVICATLLPFVIAACYLAAHGWVPLVTWS